MSKRSGWYHRNTKSDRIDFDDEQIRNYTNVHCFFDLLSRSTIQGWHETDYTDGCEILCSFSHDDWKLLKQSLPFRSVREKEMLLYCLKPDDKDQIDILCELIHTDDFGLFKSIMGHLAGCHTVLPEGNAAELIRKALFYLPELDSIYRFRFTVVIEAYGKAYMIPGRECERPAEALKCLS